MVLISDDPLIVLTLFFSLFMSTFFILTFFRYKHRVGDPKIKKFRKVSVIIPAYNEAGTIAGTIENALKLDWPKDKIEIIVVENGGSTDGTYEIAKRYEKQGVIVLQKKGGGKGSALNHAIKRAKGEIIVTMDADTYSKPDNLKKMLVYFDDPDVMASSPAIISMETKTFSQKVQNTEYLFGIFLRKIFHFLGAIYVTPGAFTAYRKKFFKKYGGYDTSNITEDFEIIMRIQSKGYKVANSISSLVYTQTPKTFRELQKQRLRWFLGFIETNLQYRGLFFSKNGGALGVLILPTAVLSIMLVLLIFIRLVWRFSKDFLNASQNYSIAQNLDLLPLVYSIKLDLFYYRVDAVLLATVVLLSLSLYMFFSARKLSRYKGSLAFGYLVYFLIYIFLFSFWWLHTIYFKFFGRKLIFGGVVWKNSVLNNLLGRS